MLIFGCAVALMTAAYMTAPFGTRSTENPGPWAPARIPKVMTIPLWILAGMAVLAGAFNLPAPVLELIGPEGLAHRIQIM